ncbi:NAD(P)-dependent alcohol dehydrogenase [Demequina sp.]|uniref:NAD(P)-dependent alcohol dehydrogenase n=1 Tax=Demequina sp. TaxID=2050685 RepID=UPI003D1488A1
MKAVTFAAYGGPEHLQIADAPLPEPGPGQVRIHVAAASLNAFDWHQYRGLPYLVRMGGNWSVKEPRILGADIAGTVDAVGADVTHVAPGDRVLAEISLGGFAEYAIASASQFAPIAPDVPFDAAAAIPMAGLTALQALRDFAKVEPGERVLVWGASGGVGHLAVQIARILGAARVDAVASARNAQMLRDIGADTAFDYASTALPTGPYDVIIDTVSTRGLRHLKPLLSERGRVVTLGGLANGKILGPGRDILGRIIWAKLVGVRHEKMLANINAKDLEWLASRLADGSLTPVIQRTFALEEIADACRVLEDGHVAGKLVLHVS